MIGILDLVEPLADPNGVKVTGWVDSRRPLDCILLVNQLNEVVGAGIRGWDREDARLAISGSRSDIGWQGVARRSPGDDIRAVVQLRGDHDFLLLAKAGGAGQ